MSETSEPMIAERRVLDGKAEGGTGIIADGARQRMSAGGRGDDAVWAGTAANPEDNQDCWTLNAWA